MKTRKLLFLAVLLATTAAVFACGSDSPSGTPQDTQAPDGGADRPTATSVSAASNPTSTPAPTPTVALEYPGMALTLEQGDFWEFRWEWKDSSCAQGSGCHNDSDSGTFLVMLGEPRTIGGVQMFEVQVTGPYTADDGATDLGPAWDYIGADGPLLVGSDGFSTVALFDARDGEWTGGGFFSRFSGSETQVAGGAIFTSDHEIASWPGVRTGAAISVVRSDSQSMCEIIEGRRICPNDSAFSITENQYYREGVGPFGYSFRSSSSFSGGGFFSSYSTEETVALVASSLRGDTIAATPTPAPTLTPTPEIQLTQIFGPQDGALTLNSENNQIPDFKTGVNIQVGVVSVTFENPDVGGGDWSYGITFRHSEEEAFHAVYVTSSGQWEHFSRGGTVESQSSGGRGTVSSLNYGVGEANNLLLVFNVDDAALFVNDVLVDEIDLTTSNARVAGDVRVIAGVLNTDTYNGADSNFYELVVLTP